MSGFGRDGPTFGILLPKTPELNKAEKNVKIGEEEICAVSPRDEQKTELEPEIISNTQQGFLS